MSDNDPTSKLINVFQDSLSPDNEVRERAEEVIQNTINEEKENFIITCINILNQSVPTTIYQITATNMIRVIKYRNREEKQSISSFLLSDDSLFSACFTTAQSLIEKEDVVLGNIGAQLLAIIYSLNSENDTIVTPFVTSVLSTEQSSIHLQNCALKFLIEVMVLPGLNDLSSGQNFIELVNFYFNACLTILNLKAEEISNQNILCLKETAVDIIIAIFDNFKNFFDNTKKQQLLEALPSSFMFPSTNLYNKLHQLIFKQCTTFYDESHEFFETIFTYINTGLDNRTPDYLIHTINFISDLAKFEGDYLEMQKTYFTGLMPKKYSHFQNLCGLSIEYWFNSLVQIAMSKDPNDIDIEDKIDYCIQTSAAMCISKLCYGAPNETFERINNNIAEYESGETWVHHFMVCIFVYSAIPKGRLSPNIEHYEESKRELNSRRMWIMEKIPNLIAYASNDDIPQLRDTALWVLTHAIHFCPEYLRGINSEMQVERLNDIMKTWILNEGSPSLLVEHVCKLMHCTFSSYDSETYKSPISPDVFSNCYDLIDSIRKSAITQENRYLFLDASDALSQLIFKASHELSKEVFPELIITIKTEIETVVANTELIFPLQQIDSGIVVAGLCRNLQYIFYSPHQINIDEIAGDFIALLLEIANDPNTIYFEEIMVTIMLIFKSVSNIEDFYTPEITGYISAGLQSDNDQSVEASVQMIRILFSKYSSFLSEQSQAYIELLTSLIGSETTTVRLGYFLEAYSSIVVSQKAFFEENETLDDIRQQFLEFLQNAVQYGLGEEQEEENCETYISFFGSLASSITCFIKTFNSQIVNPETGIEQELQKLVFNLTNRIAGRSSTQSFVLSLTTDMLKKFIDMIRELSMITSIRYNTILNKAPTKRIILIAKTKEQISEAAQRCLQLVSAR